MVTLSHPAAFLLALPVLAVLVWQTSAAARRSGLLPGDWRRIIAPGLRAAVVRDRAVESGTLTDHLVLMIWLLLVVALAGPGIDTEGKPAYGNLSGRVIVLDLGSGAAMAAQRLAANRLLDQLPEMPTAIVAATADAFDVMPLTTDRRQILRYLQVVDSSVMPVGGRALDLAFAHAESVLSRASIVAGQIVIVTGGAPPRARDGPDTGWLRAVVVVDSRPNSDQAESLWADWRDYAKAEGARLTGGERIDAVATDLERALAEALRAGDRSRIDLAPLIVALAALLWLGLFRRRLER